MVEVKVSKDGMQAELMINPEPEEELSAKLVEDYLRLEGVQAGIDKKAIEEMVEKEIFGQFVVVARGKAAEKGKDGYFDFFFETGENHGRPIIREDGSVDYGHKIVNVSSGDLLAEYHPETGGVFGYNVFAKMLPPLKGKPQRPFRCVNVLQNENKYFAAQSGHVMLSNNTISICNIFEVSGDTTYDNGNIDFNGDVHVSGNICNGITVRAAGSVIVDGVIENARVYAGLDIIVSQGIHGNGTIKDGQYLKDNQEELESPTIIEAGGQLKSKFIDHAFIKVERDIFIDYAIGSVIDCGGKVTATGTKGAIIGGNTEALGGIDADVLGNSAELPTLIRVKGIAPIIVRKKLNQNVRLVFGEMSISDCAGRFNVEFRRLREQVHCKTIGMYSEEELAAALTEKETDAEDKLTILLIDDDSRLLHTVHGILEEDYNVAAAISGKVARKYLEKNTADLILLDYLMPEENGVEVLKSLRANDKTKDIPVVFLTGVGDKNKIIEFLSLRPAGYILKPVERESLLAKIQAILSKK